jgi:hypothetical protein
MRSLITCRSWRCLPLRWEGQLKPLRFGRRCGHTYLRRVAWSANHRAEHDGLRRGDQVMPTTDRWRQSSGNGDGVLRALARGGGRVT